MLPAWHSPMNMSLRHKPLEEREELVVRLHEEENLTWREAGVRLGLSHACAWQIYIAAKARLKDFAENGADALSRLPMRARRLVVAHNIGSRALTRSAIESGRLSWNEGFRSIQWDGAILRQMGRITWAALYEWAGRPLPEPKSKVQGPKVR
jgi:hypothetical protein